MYVFSSFLHFHLIHKKVLNNDWKKSSKQVFKEYQIELQNKQSHWAFRIIQGFRYIIS